MTVNLLTTPSCTSCRKAKQWLIDHKIEFVERNIFAKPLSEVELKQIFMLSEGGTDDVISTRSFLYDQYKSKMSSMTISQVISLLATHPELIRRPILLDDKRIEFGFNEDEIRCFMPRATRKCELEKMVKEAL
ncbi:transcriptional regulator Spx [Lentilactobacillus parakefiri]|uniref:ArsR family transcriptional regulator n=1 Tax=Lentilactobacillus parakefiri TaxID=152332 RepID=A0A269YNV4_9LACO|nr:transcriptional regulator Spx [Lentilactobacillus parakefiri]PAK87223.1 ArsR family transcriptional regulator [Lentilactobacillus parakefiri]